MRGSWYHHTWSMCLHMKLWMDWPLRAAIRKAETQRFRTKMIRYRLILVQAKIIDEVVPSVETVHDCPILNNLYVKLITHLPNLLSLLFSSYVCSWSLKQRTAKKSLKEDVGLEPFVSSVCFFFGGSEH